MFCNKKNTPGSVLNETRIRKQIGITITRASGSVF